MLLNLSRNSTYQKEVIFLLLLYSTLIISFFLGENSTGGAIIDYNNQKSISKKFSEDFFSTLLSFDEFGTRHSPVLILILSFFEKINLPDSLIRFIHLHICLLLPIFFYKCLTNKFKNTDKGILLLLSALIFISPTFRSLSIWPDSRLFGLMFFTMSIFYFLKFDIEKKFFFAVCNVVSLALCAYFSPNFCVFSLFFLFKFISHYGFFSKKILILVLINLFLSLPAFYYVFILDVKFFLKSAIGIKSNENLIFDNLFNDILITFSIIFFYLIPFILLKIIRLEKILDMKNLAISLSIFLVCLFNFDYNYLYSGGGVFFKLSNFFFNNNYLFFFISFFAVFISYPLISKNYFNFLLLVLIILNNPQYTIYHKYFDPFLLIAFFTIFSFNFDLKKISIIKNYVFIFIYFLIFLTISNLKSLIVG
ncbi:MAG: hypothetical protein ACJZ4E_02750 [Candidatus Pelagibacter sp.]